MTEKTQFKQGKAKGGLARAAKLPPEERQAIARKAATARWGEKPLSATHKGNFKKDFGIDVDCYVLDDKLKTAVISQRGMGTALNLGTGGRALPRFVQGKTVSAALGVELLNKISNPLIFNGDSLGGNLPPMGPIYGYDVTVLIDVCKALVTAQAHRKLLRSQANIVAQAQVILSASAKAGIKGLVYALSGYDVTREEVIAAFKSFVREEAKKYEQEFPSELYAQWYRLYEIPIPQRGMPWNFKHLTVKHIYYPLAQSNGKILELVRANKAKDGDRQKKLFQFLNNVGARALRMQLGRVLEMAESSMNVLEYESKINDRFGAQRELDLS